MTFNSLEFLIFAVIFFAAWPWTRHSELRRWTAITIFSFIFYAYWDFRFLFLLIANGLVDYLVGLAMYRWPRSRTPLLVLSLAANLGTLALFKYSLFFSTNINHLLGTKIPEVEFILPIGLSFYTFHSMSYIIDVYRGDVKPARNLLHFYSYLSLFPHLVAGPIIRGADFLPQLEKALPITEQERWAGTKLIAHGFFKKVVIADNMAPIVNLAFSQASPEPSLPYWWLVMTMFSAQIYCDFSGYSDIARGLAKWMGYEFQVNFDHPYTSRSFREFWQRWHISLSTWFRDYVYIPLGGARKGPILAQVNMWITMLLSGFWHGASWRFIVWGALHASYLTVERVTGGAKRAENSKLWGALRMPIVFALVTIAWIFFRAHDMPQATRILKTMLNPSHAHWVAPAGLTRFAVAILLLLVVRELWVFGRRLGFLKEIPLGRTVEIAIVIVLLTASVFLRGPGSTFIYFQF